MPCLLVCVADTVVLTRALPATTLEMEMGTDAHPELLEKPVSKDDNLRMLLDLNGNVCEVVTGVSLGTASSQAQYLSVYRTAHRGLRNSIPNTHGPWLCHQVGISSMLL